MRLLGIDYGSKRVGLALSDERGRFAMPLQVLTNQFVKSSKESRETYIQKLIAEVAGIARKNNVSEVVIGESKNYEGEANAIMHESLEFKKSLEAEGFIVHLEPEFMTSVQAERLQDELKGKEGMLDASAAAVILQSYLDRGNAGTMI